MKKFYITTAIAYVNAKPHMGHALEFIQADAIAHLHRLAGYDVRFLTGADEHGIKLYRTAKALGVPPEVLVEENTAAFLELNRLLNIRYDDYIRTMDRDRHWSAVRKLWSAMAAAGDIYKQFYEGLYCSGCEKFLTDRDIQDGVCPLHPTLELESIHEENYFFRLSRYSEEIASRVQSDELRIIPETRKNEVLNLLREGLKDISFSRTRKSLPWGIPVPDDPEQTVYVWGDALTNYLSAVDFAEESTLFQKYWPADLHCIGKDITRFHTLIWPGMLLSAGLPLPRSVFIHGFVNDPKGQRMSKSSGNVVDPVEVSRRYGTDSLRYYLLREIPTTEDGNFSMDRFVDRYNADLANDLGNLVNRTIVMVNRYADGKVPPVPRDRDLTAPLREAALETVHIIERGIPELNLNGILDAIWNLVREANRYIEIHAPWALAKDPSRREDLEAVLYVLIETLRYLSILLTPFMPEKASEIWKQIGLRMDLEKEGLDAVKTWGGMQSGSQLAESKALFPRIEGKTNPVHSAPQNSKSLGGGKPTEQKDMEQIDITEFQKLKLRVATVLTAERVSGADKLLKLQIDLGDSKRQIVAGIAQEYAPESLLGKQIVVVSNLKAARIRGIESDGMLLAAHGEDGLTLITTDGPAEPGSTVS